jgi:hypothetical protein
MKLIAHSGGSCPSNEPEALTVPDNWRTSFVRALLVVAIQSVICLSQCAFARAADLSHSQSQAEHGSVAKEMELGAAYLAGRGVPRDEKKAAYWYEKAANAGDPGAQQQIGYFYQNGIGVDRDPERAAKWFERAVAGGLTSAKVNLGVAYVWGLGVRKDPEFAVQLFREAVKKGNGTAACYLGVVYSFGMGVPKDVLEARNWFEAGAKLQNPMAQFNLAMMLFQQDNLKNKDVIELLRDAVHGGYVPAMHQLGLFIIRNPALAASPTEATDLLEEAAADGSWRSSALLGVLARDGRAGVPQNKNVAYYHFRIATLQGGDSATTMLENDLHLLTSELAASNISSLDSEATAWMEQHKRACRLTLECAND